VDLLEEQFSTLRLILIPQLSPRLINSLLESFGSATKALEAGPVSWEGIFQNKELNDSISSTFLTAQKEAEIEADLRRQTSPFLTAEAFGVEDIIDPRETRPYLCSFLEAAQVGMQTRVGPRLRAGVRP